MRGKALVMLSWVWNWRITPAYAGKSWKIDPKAVGKGDHPRLCGEKLRLPIKIFFPCGSPPPMRGKVPQHSQILSKFQDHPRLCGEKIPRKLFGKSQKGSPPPMRGKAFHTLEKYVFTLGSPPPMRGKGFKSSVDAGKYRITPAYAGKSYFHENSQRKSQDHPRLCGEKFASM